MLWYFGCEDLQRMDFEMNCMNSQDKNKNKNKNKNKDKNKNKHEKIKKKQ